MRKITILFISFILIFSSTQAFAEMNDGFIIIMDTVVARPVGLVALVVGGAFFIVAFPFAATSGSLNTTADKLVGEPYRFTFTRPLGDFIGKGTVSENQKDNERSSIKDNVSQ